MAKKRPIEVDEERLERKVRERRRAAENAEGDPSIRALHKRLKRVQRKRRRLATRKQHAMGKGQKEGASA
ncbi:hypothetical protein [Candidatus Nitrospira bockiana]